MLPRGVVDAPLDSVGLVDPEGFKAYEACHGPLHDQGTDVTACAAVRVLAVPSPIAIIVGTLRGDSSSIGSLVVTAAVVRIVIKVTSSCIVRFGGGDRPSSPKTAD